jgi:protein-disulfide isomerase
VRRNVFVITAIVLVLGFLLAAWWHREQRDQRLGFMAREHTEVFVRPHSAALGAENARVVLIEFLDPACETCAAFSPIVKGFLERYDGRLRLVVRWAPFHPGAADVVRILEAARLQGRFWETLDLLFANLHLWTQHHRVDVDRVWPLLPQVGLDVERLRRDLADPRITAIIEQDLADAQTLGVQQTPGFFVNGRPLEPFGFEPLARLIDAEVRQNYPE